MGNINKGALATTCRNVLARNYAAAKRQLDDICAGASHFRDFATERLNQLQRKLDLVQEKITKLADEKISLQGRITEQRASIVSLEWDCESLERSIREAESKIRSARSAIDDAQKRKSNNKWWLVLPVIGWVVYPIVEAIQENNRIIEESEEDIDRYSRQLSRNKERLPVLREKVRVLERSRKVCEQLIKELHRAETALRNEIAELQQSQTSWSEVKQTTDQAARNSNLLRKNLKTQLRKDDAANAPHTAFQHMAQVVDSNWQNVETTVTQNIDRLLQGEDQAIVSKYTSWLSDLRE